MTSQENHLQQLNGNKKGTAFAVPFFSDATYRQRYPLLTYLWDSK